MIKFYLLFFIFTLLFFTRCEKEINSYTRPSENELIHAKYLFSKWKSRSKELPYRNVLVQRTDSSSLESYNKAPDWSKAIMYYDDQKMQTVIEVPILQNYQSAYYCEDQYSTTDTTFSPNNRSLVIIQDTAGSYFLAVCNVIPNENFVKMGGINSNNNYRTKEPNFDGVVFYTDWDDYILEGYKFIGGECIAVIDSIVHDPNNTINILMLRTDPCFIIQICERIRIPCGPITFGELQSREFCEHINCQNFVVCPEILNSSANGRGGYRGTNGLKDRWNNSGNGNSNGGGNNGGLNLGHYIEDCGDNPGFTSELAGLVTICNTKFKGNYDEFKKCLTASLIDYGEPVGVECIRNLYNLSNIEVELALELLDDPDVFNIDDIPQESINDCERKLIWRHISCALAIKNNKEIAENTTINIFGSNRLNDCSDAFRHAYFNALNVKSCGSVNAKLFADAHENCNGIQFGPDLEASMDFHNNDRGRKIAINNPNASNLELTNLVLNELNQGLLRFIFPLNPNGTINQNSQIVLTFQNCN
ncbi:MAG: hypothetical protein IPP06_07040 [Saprospiraceae bacterium]|nr:hypothetical protein [Candidatus Vicinibacter affinis]